jgi:hypothetical protein
MLMETMYDADGLRGLSVNAQEFVEPFQPLLVKQTYVGCNTWQSSDHINPHAYTIHVMVSVYYGIKLRVELGGMQWHYKSKTLCLHLTQFLWVAYHFSSLFLCLHQVNLAPADLSLWVWQEWMVPVLEYLLTPLGMSHSLHEAMLMM